MSISPTSQLRARLVVMALLAVVPALAVLLHAQSLQRSQAHQQMVESSQRLTEQAAIEYATFLDGARRLLLTLAQFPSLRDDDSRACQDVLVNVLRNHPGYTNIAVVRRDFSLFCAAKPAAPNSSPSKREWFERALATRTTALGDYQISVTTKTPTVLMAHPLLNESGEVERVLAVGIELVQLNNIAAYSRLPAGATLTLIDRHRTILARQPDGARWVGRSTHESSRPPDPARDPMGLIEAVGEDGVRRLYARAGVDSRVDAGLSVAMGMERVTAFSETNRILREQLWLLALVSLATMAAALIGGELFVVRPVKALTTVTEKLANLDLSARAQLAAGMPGLSALGKAVNTMAIALEAHQRERNRAEHTLRASEHRYRQFFDDNPHVMWVYDPETLAFLAVNQAAVDQYGYSRDEFLARTIIDMHPENEEILLDQYSFAGDEPHQSLHRHWTKDGRTLDVEVRANLVQWDGRPARLALIDDLTERRQLEEQLRQSQRMDAIGQLAGGIAHDFNNLLTAIHGYAELVADSMRDGDPVRRDVDEISRAATRAANLTRQLLGFSRRQIVAPNVLRLGDVVTNLIPMLRPLIGETIDVTAATDDRGHVRADVGQLEQVLVNLVVNARDAMPTGGQLAIETSDLSLDKGDARHYPSVPPGEYVVLVVTDTGRGMDAATKARMFEPFFTTKPPGQGTGLGLAMIYGIVQQSGGHIWVDSEVGHGSTFRIALPQVDEPIDTRVPTVGPERRPGEETILLVEDEDVVRAFVEEVLRRRGYRVYPHARPLEAIEFSRNYHGYIDLILTDVVLPQMSGKDMAVEILRNHKEARVLYMSGHTDAAIVHHGVLHPGTWFVQKPFTTDILTGKVRDLLDSPVGAV